MAMAEREIDLTTSGTKTAAECHLMPCRIEYKEKNIKAKEYFYPTIRELKLGGDDDQGRDIKHSESLRDIQQADNPILTASFRGKPLQGRKLRLPEGYTGHVISKSNSGSKIHETFNEFTYWNWDQLPNDDDAIVKALRWSKIAKFI